MINEHHGQFALNDILRTTSQYARIRRIADYPMSFGRLHKPKPTFQAVVKEALE